MRSAVSSLRHRPDYGMNNIENKNLFLFFAVILLSTSHSTPHICHCWAFFSLEPFCPLSPPPSWKIVRPPSGTREKSIGFMLCGYQKNTIFYALYFISHVWSRYEFHSPHHTKTAKQFLELSCATSAKTNRYRQISCFPCTSSPFSLFTPGVFPSLPTALLAACKEHHRDDDKSSTRKKFPSSRDYHVEKCAERNQISISFYVWVFPPAYSFHRVFGAPPSPPLSPPRLSQSSCDVFYCHFHNISHRELWKNVKSSAMKT